MGGCQYDFVGEFMCDFFDLMGELMGNYKFKTVIHINRLLYCLSEETASTRETLRYKHVLQLYKHRTFAEDK